MGIGCCKYRGSQIQQNFLFCRLQFTGNTLPSTPRRFAASISNNQKATHPLERIILNPQFAYVRNSPEDGPLNLHSTEVTADPASSHFIVPPPFNPRFWLPFDALWSAPAVSSVKFRRAANADTMGIR
ncbi:hypothetical protein BHE90_007158 [Fusarium euwallaceae]|uniref:Uncharacterized protein n=1 Tax=Fusarium euwallaceae TaxID=1147111 RepID=A0A430LRL6_9HYPO|nr:hypothetical protein BHE90_007158 [Fusarium euwallaceae]